MGNLPQDKKDKLAERVAEDVRRESQKHYDDFVKHEVSKDDARQIVRDGISKGTSRFNEANK